MRAFFCFLFFVLCFLSSAKTTEAAVTLRVMAVNPSDDQAQTVPIKVYLPVEIKPEHIIYKDDLGIAYDTQQGSYYVFGEYEIKPNETLEKEIELKDIWIIEDAQILAVRKEAKDALASFEKTEFKDKADSLYRDINKKLNEIEDVQKDSSANPTQHISDYRYCMGLLNSAKADVVAAKTLLTEIGPKGMVKLTWKLIVFIIIFLAVLGLGFYIVWQRQARIDKPLE